MHMNAKIGFDFFLIVLVAKAFKHLEKPKINKKLLQNVA
jgi:hypothetical protein